MGVRKTRTALRVRESTVLEAPEQWGGEIKKNLCVLGAVKIEVFIDSWLQATGVCFLWICITTGRVVIPRRCWCRQGGSLCHRVDLTCLQVPHLLHEQDEQPPLSSSSSQPASGMNGLLVQCLELSLIPMSGSEVA